MIRIVPLFPTLQFGLQFFERILDFLGIVLQLFAIILAQDVYFFTRPVFGDATCSNKNFGLMNEWLAVEIFVFYFTFAANVLFILLSEIYLKDTGLQYLEKKDKKTDFLLKYKTMNGIYQTFSVMFGTSAFLIYWEINHFEHRKLD